MPNEHNSRRKPLSLRAKALGSSLSVLLLYTGLMWDYIRVFTVYGDDAEVAVNSCLPWFPLSRWGEWFTEGWSHYLTSYPDWGTIAANTLKPVANLAFFVQGLLAEWAGEWAFLIGSYLAPVVTAFLAAYVFRKFTRMSDTACVLMGGIVATSAVWIGSLFGAVDIVNTFALMFSALALALLPTGELRPRPGTQIAILVAMLLAIFSHESVLPLPFVCVALLFAYRPVRPEWRDLWPYAAALGLWVLVRVVVFQGSAEIYALDPSMYPLGKVIIYWAIAAFLPVDVRGTYLARGLAPTSGVISQAAITVAIGVLVVLNLAALAVVTTDAVRHRDRRRLLLVGAFLMATAPRVFTSPSWAASRFGGLPMLVGMILVLELLTDRERTARALVAVVLAAQLLYLGTGAVELKRDYVTEARAARAYAQYAAESIDAAQPDRVVVVNDRWGYYGVSEHERYVAGLPRTVDVVAINHFDGEGAIWTTGSAGGGTVTVERVGDDIVIEVSASGGSSLTFLGAVDVDFTVPNSGFHYELLEGTEPLPRAFRATGQIAGSRTIVIGYDPEAAGFLTPQVFE